MLAMSEILKQNLIFCNGDLKKKTLEIFNIAKVFFGVWEVHDKMQWNLFHSF